MRKYLYLIKKQKIKSWLKFWLLTRDKVNYILSEIVEGTSFNLQNTVKRYFKIFNIFGNSVQDGTPSPENPVTIESVADDVNLFDESQLLEATGWTKNNSVYSGTIDNWFSKFKNGFTGLSFETNTQYTISLKGYTTGGTPRIKIVYTNNTSSTLAISAGSMTEYSITSTSGKTISSVQADFGSGSAQILSLTEFKIEQGTVATPYSPYNYGTFTIDFEGQNENYNYTFITEPLRSLPNGVRDSLEDDGIHRRVGRVVLDGSENWELWSGGTNTIGFKLSNIANLKNIQSSSTENIVLSNYFKKKTNQDRLTGEDEEGFATAAGNLYFKINRTTLNSLADWKTWLSTHNTEVLYELAEEIIEPYTEEQQAEYDKIKELYTFNGTTNISSDDEVPPYLQIQYYMKGE